MVSSIKNHIENQNVLPGKLENANANEELIVADKAKTEFGSMISHELKTPLVPMKLYCQMFMKKIIGFKSQRNAKEGYSNNRQESRTT